MSGEEECILLNLPIDKPNFLLKREFLKEFAQLTLALLQILVADKVQIEVLKNFVLIHREQKIRSCILEQIHIQLSIFDCKVFR